jgi:hypothetical protein
MLDHMVLTMWSRKWNNLETSKGLHWQWQQNIMNDTTIKDEEDLQITINVFQILFIINDL